MTLLRNLRNLRQNYHSKEGKGSQQAPGHPSGLKVKTLTLGHLSWNRGLPLANFGNLGKSSTTWYLVSLSVRWS